MIVKKQFAIHEYIEEENFLNQKAQEGYCLKRVLEDGFKFEKCESPSSYKVVYSLSDYEPKDYAGFELVSSYSSSKGGHYYYLKVVDPEASLPENDDRQFILEKNLSRIEKFNGIIIGSLLILFTYLYLTRKNPLYFIIIFAALALGIYVWRLSKKIKSALNK